MTFDKARILKADITIFSFTITDSEMMDLPSNFDKELYDASNADQFSARLYALSRIALALERREKEREKQKRKVN